VPKNPHDFLVLGFLPPPFGFPAIADISRSAQQQIAYFFASDGETVIDPDGLGPLFEVPIAGPLPEELRSLGTEGGPKRGLPYWLRQRQ